MLSNTPIQSHASILVVHDHPVMLSGICAVLAAEFACVATATRSELAEHVLQLNPDLVILGDEALSSSLDAASRIREQSPATKVLFFAGDGNAFGVKSALSAGAKGYILRSAAAEELVSAVDKVLRGHTYVSPGILKEEFPGTAPLSSREQENLRWIAEGKSSKEIAFLLNISVKTVRFHRDNIARKTGCKTTAGLTRHAVAQGLV